jgi:hypothetical protein
MNRLMMMLAMMIFVLPVMAQEEPGLPGGDPDEPVPIDGAMYVLMAAGIFYGLKSIKRNR